jgi:hypothetical protein
MQLIDLLNQLDRAGTLAQLYASGLLNIKSYNYREVVGVYRALLATPTYADQPSRAAAATAEQCRVGLRTVYRAIWEMEQVVS